MSFAQSDTEVERDDWFARVSTPLEAKWTAVIGPQTQISPLATDEFISHEEASGDERADQARMSVSHSKDRHPDMFMWEPPSPGHHAPHLSSLPPPPPPPDIALKYQTKDLQILQENLRDSRESLVGARARLNTRRREVRDVRHRTNAEMGTAFTLFKQYFLSLNTTLPSNIVSSLQVIDNLRDKLGGIENDYDDAEEEYNRQEWDYTQSEEAFVESLPDGSIVSRSPDFYREGLAEADSVTQFADATNNMLNYSGLDDLVFQGVQSSGDLDDGEALPQKLRSFSETDLDLGRPGWSGPQDRIDEWLLGGLKSSKFQQQHLRRVIAQQQFREREWFQMVTRYWFIDCPHMSILHRGDTTVSGSTENKSLQEPEGDQSPFISLTSESVQPIPKDDPTQIPVPASATCSDAVQSISVVDTQARHQLHYTADRAPNHGEPHPDTLILSYGLDSAIDNAKVSPQDARSITGQPAAEEHTSHTSPMERHDSAFPNTGQENMHALPEPIDTKPREIGLQPTQLFIKINVSEQKWNLPLLRLTPTAQSVHRLDCVPFVSIPDTRLFLPGPSVF